jgi:glycosyltransferase involved in cell wall biosynthesis
MPHQRELLRDAAVVLTMTRMEADFVISQGADEQQVYVVGAGVDVADVTGGDALAFRERHRISGGLVGAIGALAPDKGTIHLVRAVQQLRRRGIDIELVLAGPVLSAFERWYTRLDATERSGIHVLGVIDPQEKRDLLAAIDVFALPSRTESFGIVFLEAWLNRKPVVAAAVGAVTEVVADGVTGVLTSFGDEAALADAIDLLLMDSVLRDRLGGHGEALVKSRFTWDMVTTRIVTALASVLGASLSDSMETQERREAGTA